MFEETAPVRGRWLKKFCSGDGGGRGVGGSFIHNLRRVPRAYGYHCIHAQTIISFVFQEHTVPFTSMPKQ